MKKFISILLVAALALSLVACGSTETKETQAAQGEAAPAQTEAAKLSGTVSTDGSTSMEKVIGGLGEMFMELNNGKTKLKGLFTIGRQRVIPYLLNLLKF